MNLWKSSEFRRCHKAGDAAKNSRSDRVSQIPIPSYAPVSKTMSNL